jgi:heat shock protein HslJ
MEGAEHTEDAREVNAAARPPGAFILASAGEGEAAVMTPRKTTAALGLCRLALTALAVAACSAPSQADSSQAGAGSAAPAASTPERPSLYGRWRILEVDGRPAQVHAGDTPRQPEVGFGPGGYGGGGVCNGFGGVGLLVGDRWFAESPTATQMACGGEVGRQEETLFSVLSGGPTVTWEGPDTAVLRTGKGVLRLRRLEPLPDRPAVPAPEPMLMAGTRWDLYVLDAAVVDGPARSGGARLGFEADRWTLETACGARSGAYRQEEGAVRLEAGAATNRPCSPDQARRSEALARALTGRLAYVVGFNGELVLAGTEHWAAGRRDVGLGREQANLLSGRWRVASVDGVPPPASERPAELAFGPGAFAVWDGCRHSEGVAIIRERQLLALGSGMVTAANCPADPVRAKINAVVAAEPRIALAADGAPVLVSRAGTLRLERKSSQAFGTGVETRLRSGQVFDLMAATGGPPPRLTMGPGNRFSLTLPCGTMQGRWRSESTPWGSYTRLGPDRPPPGCEGQEAATRLFNFLAGDLWVAIGPNRDFALFVSGRERLSARPVTAGTGGGAKPRG